MRKVSRKDRATRNQHKDLCVLQFFVLQRSKPIPVSQLKHGRLPDVVSIYVSALTFGTVSAGS